VRKILVIGIGVGDPEQLTIQAVNAMQHVNAFFVLDKGSSAPELIDVRTFILERYLEDQSYRVVELADPPRDRASDDYHAAVQDWHARRAQVYALAIRDELADDECGAFLVWGDPSLYDSTLRILEQVLAAGLVQFEYKVVPGITSIQALTAKQHLLLNGIGESVFITTGRRLVDDWARGIDNVVVMLDGACGFTRLDPEGVDIFWGAYLGMPDEICLSGPLADMSEVIQHTRAAARARKGWIMDTYLLRRRARA
jgi:precorrin-6A synthase